MRFAAPGSSGTGPVGFAMQPVGSQDIRSGATYGTAAGVTYNPETATMLRPGASPRPPILG